MTNMELAAKIAPIVHAANKAYCESLGDFSQKDWHNSSPEFKQSSITGVQFRLENPDSSAEDQHNQWMAMRINDGWVYGAKTDRENKIHDCLIPYNELPEAQRKKDALFQAIVDAIK